MYRIMYFLDYAKSLGGAALIIIRQAMLMKESGQQVQMVISDYNGEEISEEYQKKFLETGLNDILKLTYPIAAHPENIDIVSVIENYATVKEAVMKYQPQILHSVQLNPIVELVSRELGIPHIMNIYQAEDDFFSINYYQIFPHYHICDSDLYANVWSKNLATESICIRTMTPHLQLEEQNVSHEEFVNYVCVGNVVPRKNQLEVIKAFHKALQNNLKGILSIYGHCKSTYAQKCMDYVIDNHLSQNVIFKGFHTDMQRVYQNSDVLICGSVIESCPNVIPEAMSSGTMIISTPVAGVPEIIKDGINGLLCEGFESDDILKKLIEYVKIKKSGHLEDIIDNAYKTYKLQHTPEAVTKKLISFYQYVTEKNENPNNAVTIMKTQETFETVIRRYKNNLNAFSNKDMVRKKLWFLNHIKERITDQKLKYYIWGADVNGTVVKEMLDVFFPAIELEGFIDAYKSGRFMDYTIQSPNIVLNKEECIIFVAVVKAQKEIVTQLRKMNKRCNWDYFVMVPRVW